MGCQVNEAMKVKRFSASYVYERSAFALLGIPDGYRTDHPLFPLLCVAKNLICRGAPTRASDTLREALGPVPASTSEQPHFVDASHQPDWTDRIKGAEDGFNPALRFWEALCCELPDDLVHLKALILPEASLERILDAANIPADELVGQQVDFYCPIAHLVIEIDGRQHEEEAQRLLDARRDELLRLAGVRTLRIPTSLLAHPGKAAAKAVEELRRGLAWQGEQPICCLSELAPDIQVIRTYELTMRFQIVFLELMQAGVLDPRAQGWRIRLMGDAPFSELESAASAALQDLFMLLENLAILANVGFTAPLVAFTSEEAALTLDISAFRTWDSADSLAPGEGAVIRIRSAHDILRDEFRLSTAQPITYDTPAIGREEATEALRFFLRRLFGHEDFRPGQLGIIRRALARKATLGILPTGSGKSVCYQMACLLQPAVGFVVCPIISLMQDQDRSLKAQGVAQVARLDSQMSTASRARVRRGLGEGRYQLIWVSPERFQDAAFRQELLQISRTLSFGYAVIDEVHCLSEWGHDFRVSYLLLHRTFARYCPGACLLGLTATASRDVLADLKAELGITSQNIQSASVLSRPELHFHVRRTTSDARLHDLDAVLDEVAARRSLGKGAVEAFQPQGAATLCGIIFANTRSGNAAAKLIGCEEIKDHLRARGIPAETYHSGRADQRAQIQRCFMDNDFPIMVATKSFGMGIDKSNVRFTVHANLPWSIEAFYQEAGRAGRSQTGNESDCYILYVPDTSEERIHRLFSRSTTIEEIHQLQPELEGDLGTIFFLWTLGFASFSEELERILLLLSKLNEARTGQDVAVVASDAVDDADVRPDHRGTQTEKALYKLAVCGFVQDWTRDWNSNTLTVQLTAADGTLMQQAEEAVEAYIGRHSPGFSLTHPRPAHQRYVDLYQMACEGASGNGDERIAALIGLLLMWTNDTIVYSRRAAIGNMLALCQADLSDEQIAAYINGYFKLDAELSDRLEKVAESPDDLQPWLDVFYEYAPAGALAFQRCLRPNAWLLDVGPLADRFRESYPASIGLEWTSLMAKLLANGFSQEDVSDQLAYVLNEADRNPGLDFDWLLDETAELVQLCSSEAQAAYEHAIADWSPDFRTAAP